MSLCYFNGSFLSADSAALPITDLAFQRGIAVFDTVRTYSGRPFALSRHLERLAFSAAASHIALPVPLDEIGDIVREGVSRFSGDSLAKVFITGGDVERDGTFPFSRLLILFAPLAAIPEEVYTKGVALSLLPVERHFHFVKSINYMVPFSSRCAGTFEPLYCPGGEITESATSSFFAVKDGILVTAPDSRVLRGITREIVLEIAGGNGLRVELRCPTLEEIASFSEAFVTGSVKEVAPVVKIGDLAVGEGIPGPITLRLLDLFRKAVRCTL